MQHSFTFFVRHENVHVYQKSEYQITYSYPFYSLKEKRRFWKFFWWSTVFCDTDIRRVQKEMLKLEKEHTINTEMSEKIVTKFTSEQVDNLNEYQQSGMMHPFTCANDGDEIHVKYEFEKLHPGEDYQTFLASERAKGIPYPEMAFTQTSLVATEDGWVCPACDPFELDNLGILCNRVTLDL